ncbi:hypothetical protein DXG01_000562, partial [Tephrocybe rancida]
MQLSDTTGNDTGGQQFNTTIEYNHAERGSFFDDDGDTVMYPVGNQPPGLHLSAPPGLSFDAPPGLHPAAPGYPGEQLGGGGAGAESTPRRQYNL